MSRLIKINDSLNKNKLFNYILQSVETERNILILDKLSRLDMGQKQYLYYTHMILFYSMVMRMILNISKKLNE